LLLDGWFLKGAAAVVAVAGSGCNLLLMAEEGGGGGGSAEEGKLGIVTDLNEGGQVFFLVGGGERGGGFIPETLGHKGLAFFQNKEYPESEMDQN
jgi:hypothetical protein